MRKAFLAGVTAEQHAEHFAAMLRAVPEARGFIVQVGLPRQVEVTGRGLVLREGGYMDVWDTTRAATALVVDTERQVVELTSLYES